MAYALVAQAKGNGNDNYSTGLIDTTGANLLILSFADTFAEGSPPTISDTYGNTWLNGRDQSPFGQASRIWYVENPTVGTGHSVTVTGTDQFGSAQFSAFSGAATSSVLDQTNENLSFGSSSVQPGSVTPTEDDELVVVHFTFDVGSGGMPTVNSGFTSPMYGDVGSGGTYLGSGVAYLIQTTAAAVNPTCTRVSGSSNNYATIATFKASASGPQSVTVDPAALVLTGQDVTATNTPSPVTRVATGAKSAGGTTTVSIAYPASVAAGQLALAGRAGWEPTVTFTDESGWTNTASLAGGTGTATDAHQTAVRVDRKELVGSESGSVTFDQTVSGQGGCVGVMASYAKADSGATWTVATSTGDDATHGANRSVTGSSSIALEWGDVVVAVVAVDTDTDLSPTSPAITASGVTFGPTTRLTSGAGVGTGDDGNIEVFEATVVAGSGTAAPTLAFTTATSQCGPAAFVRLRTVAPQTAAVDPAALTLTGQQPAIAGAGTAVVAIDAATLTLAGQSIAVVVAGVWTQVAPPGVELDPDVPSAGSNFGFQSIALADDGTVYVTKDHEGLFRSTDHGDTWTHISTDGDLESGTPWTLQVDPFDPDVLWSNAGFGNGGPFKSTDGGATWTKMAVGAPTQNDDVYSIALDPLLQDHVLVAWHSLWVSEAYSGISESFDGGDTWTNHHAPTDDWGTGHAVFFLSDSDTWLVATQTDGIWRTANSGTSWTQVHATPITHGATDCLTQVGSSLFLAHEDVVSESTDDGATWTDISTGITGTDDLSTIATDGVNLYTAPSFPIAGNNPAAEGPWWTRPVAGGTWTQLTSSPDPTYLGVSNGPRQSVYADGYTYTSNYLAGVWRLVAEALEPTEITVDAATLTLTGQDTATSFGVATVAVDPATATLTGQQPALAGTGIAAATVDTATLTLVGQDATITTGAATVSVDAAVLTLTAQDVASIATGIAAVTVDVAAVTLAGQDAPAAAVGAGGPSVDVAVLAVAGQDVTVTATGAAAVAIDAAALALSSQDVVATAGVVVVVVDAATLTLAGGDIQPVGSGTTATAIDTAQIALAGVDPEVTTGAGAIAVDPAVLTLAAQDIAAIGTGATAVDIDPALLVLLGGVIIASVVTGRDIVVAGTLASRRWAGNVVARRYSGEIHARRWEGTLTDG